MSDYRLSEFISNMVEITKDEFQDLIRGKRPYVSILGAVDGSFVNVYSEHTDPLLALEKFPNGRMHFYAKKVDSIKSQYPATPDECYPGFRELHPSGEWKHDCIDRIMHMYKAMSYSADVIYPAGSREKCPQCGRAFILTKGVSIQMPPTYEGMLNEARQHIEYALSKGYCDGIVISEGEDIKIVHPLMWDKSTRSVISKGYNACGELKFKVILYTPDTQYLAYILDENMQDAWREIIDEQVEKNKKELEMKSSQWLESQMEFKKAYEMKEFKPKSNPLEWWSRLLKNPAYYIITRVLMAIYLAMGIFSSPNIWLTFLWVFGTVLILFFLVMEIRDLIKKQ